MFLRIGLAWRLSLRLGHNTRTVEIKKLIDSEEQRRTAFPILAGRLFPAHAAVSPLPPVSYTHLTLPTN